MHIVGILGGIASGKSLVAEQLAQLGAGVLDADRAGHEVLTLPEVVTAVRVQFGNAVMTADGRIDRAKLAAVVFAPPPRGPAQRKYLEQITHPHIKELLDRDARELARHGCRVAVLDAPLLLEAGWDRLCDTLVFVDAPDEVRQSRAMKRGWSQEEFAARECAQESLDFKRVRADVVLDNSGPPEATLAQVERFWQSLLG